jgi:hypothetical protein
MVPSVSGGVADRSHDLIVIVIDAQNVGVVYDEGKLGRIVVIYPH